MKTLNRTISIVITLSIALTSACATSGNISSSPASMDEMSAQWEAGEHARSERHEARQQIVNDVRQRAMEADARVAIEHVNELPANMSAAPTLCDPRICNPAGPRW